MDLYLGLLSGFDHFAGCAVIYPHRPFQQSGFYSALIVVRVYIKMCSENLHFYLLYQNNKRFVAVMSNFKISLTAECYCSFFSCKENGKTQ